MMTKHQQHWLDLKLSRLIALLISSAALFLAVVIHKSYNQTHTYSSIPQTNIVSTRCMEARIKAIETMVAEKIINNHKAALFEERATALCSSRSPPH